MRQSPLAALGYEASDLSMGNRGPCLGKGTTDLLEAASVHHDGLLYCQRLVALGAQLLDPGLC